MPYTSDAQRRWAHTAAGTKALGGPDKVAEWDKASKGKDLPARAKGMAEGGLVKATRSSEMKDSNATGFPDVREEYTARPLDVPMTKGTGLKPLEAAKGGPVLQEGRSIFMKRPDPFRTDAGRQDYDKKTPGGEMSNPKGDGKSLPPVKPRK